MYICIYTHKYTYIYKRYPKDLYIYIFTNMYIYLHIYIYISMQQSVCSDALLSVVGECLREATHHLLINASLIVYSYVVTYIYIYMAMTQNTCMHWYAVIRM